MEFKVKPLVPGDAEGVIAIVNKYISFLGDIDLDSGALSGYGPLKGKILIFPGSRGSTVGPYVIYGLSKKSLAPNAMIVKDLDPLLIAGCVISSIPLALANDWSNLINYVEKHCNGRECLGKLLSNSRVLIIE